MRNASQTLVSLLLLFIVSVAMAEDPVFSGPQAGEKLAPFEARVVFGKQAGDKLSVLDTTREGESENPVLLVFVHKVTRPAIGLIRLVFNYAESTAKGKMQSKLIFLTKDPTDTEALLKRARRALPESVEPLISVDGEDGPGAYGLNRDMTLTVLIAKSGTVTANFPLVQPSVQADGPAIGHEIVKVLGGKDAPTLKDMGFTDRRMRARMSNAGSEMKLDPRQNAIYRSKIAPVIRGATKTDVVAAAEDVEKFAAKNEWFKRKVHHASNLIVSGGKLSNYGNETAQDYLKKWAKEFAPPKNERRAAKRSAEDGSVKKSGKETSTDQPATDSSATESTE